MKYLEIKKYGNILSLDDKPRNQIFRPSIIRKLRRTLNPQIFILKQMRKYHKQEHLTLYKFLHR